MFGSRPVMAHPNDVFIRNVALLGLLFLTVLFLWDASTTTQSDGEITCWAPAYLTDSHRVYSNRICRETNNTYQINQGPNVTADNLLKKIKVLPSEQGRKHWSHGIIENMGKKCLIGCLIAEAAITVVAFTLLRNIAGRACSQARILMTASGGSDSLRQVAAQLRNSYGTVASYVIVELFYFIAMVVVVAQIRNSLQATWNSDKSFPGETQVFMCDFEVRSMGNMQPHTLQCMAIPPEPDVANGVPLLVMYADCVLCGVVALLVALHTVQLVLLSPASADVMESSGLEGATSLWDRLRFGFSDMNLAASLLPTLDVLQIVVVQGKETGEDSDPKMTIT